MPPAPSLPRRNLQELLAIHRLNPDLRDVIVEGSGDKTVVEWFLEEHERKNFAVYEVEVFEVDPHEILARGLQDNNRGRVITLADKVTAESPADVNISFIADRDFDLVLDVDRSTDVLLFTDYTCMLMYTLSDRVLNKYLRIKHRRLGKAAARVIREAKEALEILFAFRLANHVLQSGLKAVPWQDSCDLCADGIQLDLADYVNRYLNKNRRNADKPHFIAQIAECRSWMQFDLRLQIRGHDFIAILIWYISHHPGFGAFARTKEEVVEQDLMSCLELRDLDDEHLFQQLLARIPA